MFKIEPERSKKRNTHNIIQSYPHYFQPPLTRAHYRDFDIFTFTTFTLSHSSETFGKKVGAA